MSNSNQKYFRKLQPQPQAHLVMTFGKQRNATRWKRRKNVESRKFRKNAKKRVEFVRYQDDFSKLFLCKWYLYLIIDNYPDNWNKTKIQLYKFESIFNRSTKCGLPEWATDCSCDVFKARAQYNLSSNLELLCWKYWNALLK